VLPLLTSLAVASLAWEVVVAVLVARDLERRAVPVNKWVVRFLICAYAGLYRRVTLEATGRAAPLFYSLVGSTALTLGFTVAAVVVRGRLNG
jgi:hypothetical protein